MKNNIHSEELKRSIASSWKNLHFKAKNFPLSTYMEEKISTLKELLQLKPTGCAPITQSVV
jgi:hypothetical protein